MLSSQPPSNFPSGNAIAHGRAYYWPVLRDSENTNWTNEALGIHGLSRWICNWGKKAHEALSHSEGHLGWCCAPESKATHGHGALPACESSPTAASGGASLLSASLWGCAVQQVLGNVSQAQGVFLIHTTQWGHVAVGHMCRSLGNRKKGREEEEKTKRLKWKSNVLFYRSFWKLFLAATGHEPILLVLPFHMPSHAHQEDGWWHIKAWQISKWERFCSSGKSDHRIIESLRLEKTTDVINPQPPCLLNHVAQTWLADDLISVPCCTCPLISNMHIWQWDCLKTVFWMLPAISVQQFTFFSLTNALSSSCVGTWPS